MMTEDDDVEESFRVTLGQIIAEKQSFDGFGGLGRFLIYVIVAFAIALLWTVDNSGSSRNEITHNLRAWGGGVRRNRHPGVALATGVSPQGTSPRGR